MKASLLLSLTISIFRPSLKRTDSEEALRFVSWFADLDDLDEDSDTARGRAEQDRFFDGLRFFEAFSIRRSSSAREDYRWMPSPIHT